MLRQPYCPGEGSLVVSPLNARDELSAFIKAAKETLLIYDPEVSDAAMVRLLNERMKAGVAVRIIGRAKLPARKLAKLRLHTRTFVRDGEHVFVGSQSLRRAELEKRREVGVIFRDSKIAAQITKIFDEDWGATQASSESAPDSDTVPLGKIAKRVAKVVAKGLPPVAPVIQAAVKEVAGNGVAVSLKPDELEEVVEDAVKHAVKEAVRDAFEDAVPPLKER
jgi:phosphatidylserine/phosphatidylglycerophosphate/cardiolipin synthase-like enzyme